MAINVKPAIIEAKNEFETVQKETFAPILYMIKYTGGVEQAIQIQNGVKQGLSSALFSTNMMENRGIFWHKLARIAE